MKNEHCEKNNHTVIRLDNYRYCAKCGKFNGSLEEAINIFHKRNLSVKCESKNGAILVIGSIGDKNLILQPSNEKLQTAQEIREEFIRGAVAHGFLPCPCCKIETPTKIEEWAFMGSNLDYTCPECGNIFNPMIKYYIHLKKVQEEKQDEEEDRENSNH